MPEPIIVTAEQDQANPEGTLASGGTLEIQLWEGSAPYELHVHYQHDIAWHILEGSLHFRFADREADVHAGSTLFIPAGTPHTYGIEPSLHAGVGRVTCATLCSARRGCSRCSRSWRWRAPAARTPTGARGLTRRSIVDTSRSCWIGAR